MKINRRQITKKKNFKTFKRYGNCPCDITCSYAARRKWRSKKAGYFFEDLKEAFEERTQLSTKSNHLVHQI